MTTTREFPYCEDSSSYFGPTLGFLTQDMVDEFRAGRPWFGSVDESYPVGRPHWVFDIWPGYVFLKEVLADSTVLIVILGPNSNGTSFGYLGETTRDVCWLMEYHLATRGA